MSVIVVVESAHAAGKSTQVDRVAAALGWRAYHHPDPPDDVAEDVVGRALWYACRRRAFLRALTVDDKVIVSRWWDSTSVIATRLTGLLARSLFEVVTAEMDATPTRPSATVLLDVDGETLDSRLVARWTHDTELWALPPYERKRVVEARLTRERRERAIYREKARRDGWRVVDANGSMDEVTARLVAVCREVTG